MKGRKKNTTPVTPAEPRPVNPAIYLRGDVRPPSKAGASFAPYLDRFLDSPSTKTGQKRLLDYVEHCRLSGEDADPAFFELVGRMAALHFETFRAVLQRIGREPIDLWDSAEDYRAWESTLMPLAKEAKEWIKREWRKKPLVQPKRAHLWNRYLDDESRPYSEAWKALSGDAQHELREGQNAGGSAVFPSRYLDSRIVPRGLFFLLTRTKPENLSPSEAVRRYLAGEPLRLSWSRPSRTLRK